MLYVDAPDDPKELRLAVYASHLVYEATKTSVYPVDGNGMPVETKTREAFKQAVLAQLDAWETNSIDPFAVLKPGTTAVSKSLGPASFTIGDIAQGVTAQETAKHSLCVEAHAIISPWIKQAGAW